MFWNFLKGLMGDKTHAVLCGVGLNLRKVLRKLRELLLASCSDKIVDAKQPAKKSTILGRC